MKDSTIYFFSFCVFSLFAAETILTQELDISSSDFDGNGKVGFSDFLIFSEGFGKTSGQKDFNIRLDLSGNGTIDFDDFLFFTRYFGRSSSESVKIFLYIADLNGGKIEIIDTTSNLLDPSLTIWVQQPRGIALSDINRQIYIAAIDTFLVFNHNGTLNYKIPLIDPVFEPNEFVESRGGFKVVLSTNHQLAFVTEESASLVEVFDIKQRLSVAQIPVPSNPSSIAITPEGNEVYVTHGHNSSSNLRPLSVIDGLQHTLKDSIHIGNINANRMALALDGNRLYLNNLRSGQIQVVNPSERTVVDSFTVGDPTDLSTVVQDIAISKDGSRLYAIANRTILELSSFGNLVPRFIASLFIIDAIKLEKIDEITVGQFAGTLAITPNGQTAYISGVENLEVTGGSPILQIFVVDLKNKTSHGAIRGFALPVDFKFSAQKLTLSRLVLPEVKIF